MREEWCMHSKVKNTTSGLHRAENELFLVALSDKCMDGCTVQQNAKYASGLHKGGMGSPSRTFPVTLCTGGAAELRALQVVQAHNWVEYHQVL
eukprot:1144016-Pelagomonas_calceolata.AAC.1